MNPVDHPHGGGEGRTSGGRNPVTPWGYLKEKKQGIIKNRYIYNQRKKNNDKINFERSIC